MLRQRLIVYYLNQIHPLLLKSRARRIGKKEKIKVVFFAMNVATWHYQGILDLLSRDSRFDCFVVLTVLTTYSKEQQHDDLIQLRDYFKGLGISFIDHNEEDDLGFDVKNIIDPDILFYPQPYEGIYISNHSFSLFKNKLLCYQLYAVNVISSQDTNYWLYNLPFHNLAWKVYCAFESQRKDFQKYARNKGRNVVVSGYANLDYYLNDDVRDVWKIKDRSIKRLIWAPHFTISKLTFLNPRSNFLWLSEMMLGIAENHRQNIQIAFKPHPRLKSELYKHPDWGRERTDKYYSRWENGENTQLETGGFIDLFKSSDAMIHDCGSFTAEYLFVNKPVAFVTTDKDSLVSDHNDFGREALAHHYIVTTKEEVQTFVDNVVLRGNDTMMQQRTDYFNSVLSPSVKGTTSQIIYDDLKTSLGLL